MKSYRVAELAGALSFLTLISTPGQAAEKKAKLEGFQEVPVVSTDGEGKCRVRSSSSTAGDQLEVELSYSGLEGNVQQAHIHMGQRDVNGGIVLFFCSNVTTPVPPTGTPSCPGPHDGTITRTLTTADVVPQTTQGIAAGQLNEVIDAIRKGKAYCNVHTDMSPAGEIRGQLR